MTNTIPKAVGAKSGLKLNGFGNTRLPGSGIDLPLDNERGSVLDSTAGGTTPGDARFVQTAISVVEKHLSNYKFNIHTLAIDLKMSRRQLFRKFKALAGCTPNVFIRNLRLKRAAELLRTSRMTILEITYAVGFGDPKYFRIIFRQKYGMLPSIYAKQCTDGSIR